MARQIVFRRQENLSFFGEIDGFFGESERLIGAGFDLDKNQRLSLAGDEVYLAAAPTIPLRDNFIPLLAQEVAGSLFSFFPAHSSLTS